MNFQKKLCADFEKEPSDYLALPTLHGWDPNMHIFQLVLKIQLEENILFQILLYYFQVSSINKLLHMYTRE